MKKIFVILLGIFLVIILFLIIKYVPNENTLTSNKISAADINLSPTKIPKIKPGVKAPIINAKASYLIDVDSAYPMYAQNDKLRVPIASTTKIMTAIVVLEDYSSQLKDIVTITSNMVDVEPSVINLKPGEKISIESLLHGLLIMSGNDAAYSLADYFGGREQFVKKMNGKVAQLGLKDTQLKDPAGLNDDGYSTAHDLAIIASYALRIPEFAKIVSIPTETIYSNDGRILHDLTNSNRLMRSEEPLYFPFSIGGKTGFTYAAGHVLVSAAKKDDHYILAVVLNTDEDSNSASAKESKKLLEWGFDNWQW